jgi:hypothetical protein
LEFSPKKGGGLSFTTYWCSSVFARQTNAITEYLRRIEANCRAIGVEDGRMLVMALLSRNGDKKPYVKPTSMNLARE